MMKRLILASLMDKATGMLGVGDLSLPKERFQIIS